MLVRNVVSSRVPIPHEAGQWMVFRRLSIAALDTAVAALERKALDRLSTVGAEKIAADRVVRSTITRLVADAKAKLEQANAPESDKPETVALMPPIKPLKPNPYALYDRATMLQLGIAEWSYGSVEEMAELLKSADDVLDPTTANWALREVFLYNDLLPDEAEARLGN